MIVTLCRHIARIILRVIYGITKNEDLDFYINLVHKAVESNSATIRHGNFVVDYYPAFEYVPGKYLTIV
jgi:hypothetical protein